MNVSFFLPNMFNLLQVIDRTMRLSDVQRRAAEHDTITVYDAILIKRNTIQNTYRPGCSPGKPK